MKGQAVVREPDLPTWRAWMTDAERVLARDHVGSVVVITQFVGVDMRPRPGEGPPLVFETSVEPPVLLGGRYAATGEAIAGHREALRQARAQAEN